MVGIVSMFSKKLAFLNSKVNILAENIAKSEIPGYQRKDIAQFQKILEKRNDKNFSVKRSDIVQTKHEVIPEYEINEVNNAYIENQLIISHLSKMYGLIDTVTGNKG